MIPKGTPAGTIANIAHVAVENVKIAGKMATGELTVKEGLEKMEQTTVATVAGSVFGPVGIAVGGLIGGTIGYMAGSKVGETIVKGAQKIRKTVGEGIKSAAKTVIEVAKSIRLPHIRIFG